MIIKNTKSIHSQCAYIWLHFISIVTLDVLLIISNFSTTYQVTLITVLVYYHRLSLDC